MPDNVITVENISKRYCRSLRQGMLYAISDIASDTIGLPINRSVLRRGEFWSLKDISLEVKQGECLGLIGVNGAGKSTLLKLINGIIRPDAGTIRVGGRVGALIEVGAGFHPMLSGRENIYINGAILGMSKREIDRKFDEIVSFADLPAGALEAPVKTYSSGMYVRLGFAVAIHCEPDILLIDEVLAVGDARFIGKCHQRIQKLLSSGVSCILVSHSLNMIESFCSQAILLQAGQITEKGTARIATARYRQMILEQPAISEWAVGAIERSGVAIISVQVRDKDNRSTDSFPCGAMATIEVNLQTKTPIRQGIFTLSMQRRPDGLIPLAARFEIGRDIPCLQTGIYRFRLPLIPSPGHFKAWATVSGMNKLDILDQVPSTAFEITASDHMPDHIVGDTSQGVCILPPDSIDIYGPESTPVHPMSRRSPEQIEEGTHLQEPSLHTEVNPVFASGPDCREEAWKSPANRS